jgi:hypothetical protein
VVGEVMDLWDQQQQQQEVALQQEMALRKELEVMVETLQVRGRVVRAGVVKSEQPLLWCTLGRVRNRVENLRYV